MSQFTEALVVTPLADGKSWIIYKDFFYDVGSVDSGDRIQVDLGFVTDFASIPRFLWWALPKWGVYGNASVIHDWLYWKQNRTRSESDHIMREAMIVLGVKSWKVTLIFIAIRTFGWWAWARNGWDKKAGLNRVVQDQIIDHEAKSNRPGILKRTMQQVIPESKKNIREEENKDQKAILNKKESLSGVANKSA